MWRSNKFIVAIVIAAALAVGAVGGVVMAADGEEDNGPVDKLGGFIDKGKSEAASTEYHNVQLAMTAGMIDNNLTSVTDG